MSDLKVDGIISSTGTNTALTLQGKGTGKVDIGDGALSFPDADGDADQVIKTDGSGTLAFVTPAAGGAWNIIGTAVASGSASLTITGLDSTYDTYAIELSDIILGTTQANSWFRLGDSGGIDSGGTDYEYTTTGWSGSGSVQSGVSTGAAQILLNADSGIAAGTGAGHCGSFKISQPGDSTMYTMINGLMSIVGTAGDVENAVICSSRNAVITHTQVQYLPSTGTITTGRMTVWGLAHA